VARAIGLSRHQIKAIPKSLGIILIVGGGCYLIDLFAPSGPDLGQMIHGFVVIPCAIAEIWMVLYLLVVGVRTPLWRRHLRQASFWERNYRKGAFHNYKTVVGREW